LFWLFFAICLVCFCLRTFYNNLKFKQQRLADSKRATALMYVNMAALWAAWFSMNFWDPVRIMVPAWLRYTGLLLFVAGVLLFILGDAAMRGLASEKKLVTSGIFSKMRHPVYTGFIVWVVGFPIFMQAILTLTSAVFWVGFFLCWKYWEECALERRFPEYRDYKGRTWF
jgi:protein-S-isoprenylcysteine O-methyltransferase Ste14